MNSEGQKTLFVFWSIGMRPHHISMRPSSPITPDNRLSARDVANFNSKNLKRLQTAFFEKVGKDFGLERGVPKEKTQRKHLSVLEYKRVMNEINESIDRKAIENRIKNDLRELGEQARKGKKNLKKLGKEYQGLQREINEATETLKKMANQQQTYFSENQSLEVDNQNLQAKINEATETLKKMAEQEQSLKTEIKESFERLDKLSKMKAPKTVQDSYRIASEYIYIYIYASHEKNKEYYQSGGMMIQGKAIDTYCICFH